MGTLEIPTVGGYNKTADPQIKSDLETLNNLLDASNKIPGTSLAAEAKIADTQLISPNNAAYRSLLKAYNFISFESAAGTYILGSGSATGAPKTSGSNLITSPAEVPPFFQFAKADYEVGGKTQKLRLRAQVTTNATKPTFKYTFGLYPFTTAGGGTELVVTLGTVVSGSTVEFNEPPPSTVTSKETSDFTIPADGAYCLGVVTSAKLNGGTAAMLGAELQTRSI
jgi:hypothetical protein